MEQNVVSGIAYARDEAKVTLLKVADKPGVAAQVFGPLAEANINVDMIVQNVSEDGRYTDSPSRCRAPISIARSRSCAMRRTRSVIWTCEARPTSPRCRR